MSTLDSAIEELVALADLVRKMSYADNLTPLGNALALEKIVSSNAFDRGEFDVVVFGDLNEFKSLNDSHGHDAGDAGIRQAGVLIQEYFVDSDIKAKGFRTSGDEFVILLKQEKIVTFREKAAQFASIDFSHQNNELTAKMSFGFAIGDDVTDFRELKTRAEMACRFAKTLGHGTVEGWTGELQRNTFTSKRKTCPNCGAVNSCSVPPNRSDISLVACSCCGHPFAADPL
ncbi:MAG TPA: GGDEF domain-containing protein [Pyrinomonadaceae bacterium]|nr:GGDEF domain-containing protein [Pyrinomonadaceae bacterium]